MKEHLAQEADRCVFQQGLKSLDLICVLGCFNVIEHEIWSKVIITAANEYKKYTL